MGDSPKILYNCQKNKGSEGLLDAIKLVICLFSKAFTHKDLSLILLVIYSV